MPNAVRNAKLKCFYSLCTVEEVSSCNVSDEFKFPFLSNKNEFKMDFKLFISGSIHGTIDMHRATLKT